MRLQGEGVSVSVNLLWESVLAYKEWAAENREYFLYAFSLSIVLMLFTVAALWYQFYLGPFKARAQGRCRIGAQYISREEAFQRLKARKTSASHESGTRKRFPAPHDAVFMLMTSVVKGMAKLSVPWLRMPSNWSMKTTSKSN
eukprot:TRINITY_DN73539_c0_g1_i1.p1 TRINITY_DN73539_c0_g1~~TRINITY_DN73539_c0_g1_i1.p1  ORF type:complete len:143 (-),score=9.82 TRINITY_DN73539_c0_g1_i1:197-625(-)